MNKRRTTTEEIIDGLIDVYNILELQLERLNEFDDESEFKDEQVVVIQEEMRLVEKALNLANERRKIYAEAISRI